MSTVFAITCRGTIPACGALLGLLSVHAAARAGSVAYFVGPMSLAVSMIIVGAVAWMLEPR
jgi:hypothetical protein